VTFPSLHPSNSDEEHTLRELALEWSLADPIVIDSTEDVKSKVNWQETLEPFHHQMRNLMTFCRRLPVSLIADDVGLGKTISAGLILSELMIRNRVSRCLVICPSILGPQWVEELETKFGIAAKFATGTGLDSALRGSTPVIVTTYQSASPRLEKIVPGTFDMLILDEAHKIRNLYGTPKPPRFATRIRDALDQRLFRYVVMLTATPIQNRLWDLYSLVDCLAVAKGHENPFGDKQAFRDRFIQDSAATARRLKPSGAAEFREILNRYLVRTRRAEVQLPFPERKVQLFSVTPTPLDSALERRVAEGLEEISANGLVQTTVLTALMSSPHALLDQLQNMSQKNPDWLNLARDVERLTAGAEPSAKFKGLFHVVGQLRERRPDNWRLVIFTTRKLTQKAICRALDDRQIPHGTIKGGKPAENLETIRGFREEPPRYNVVVSTDAGAEGVNLQSGNVVVNFDLPWNPMIVEQRIGRVQRLASQHSHVVIVNMAVQGSAEERVVARLMEKLQTIVDSVGDIEAILEGTSNDNDVDSRKFEDSIRKLVLQSLSGQDVDAATALAEKSIQDAKELFESQRQELDQTLGDLTELHNSGPSMPQLNTREPAVPFPEFVERGLIAEGYALQPDPSGTVRATRPGRPAESITFDEAQWRRWTQPGVFQGKTPLLYAPGKPQFERLVQRWLDRGGHRIVDLTGSSQLLAEKLLTDWLESKIEDSELTSLTIDSSESHFRGTARLKATATNSVDSYEKIIDTEKTADRFRQIPASSLAMGLPLVQEVEPESVAPSARERTEQACLSDSDITAFCSFYEGRLAEELARTGDDQARRQKVESDLRPVVHADCITLSGQVFDSCTVTVQYSLDGHSGYSLSLLICPATGEVFREDFEWGRCTASGRAVPETCLVQCECSQQPVLRHLTVVSDETGRRALASYAVTCPLTSRRAFSDELSQSDISGRQGVASEFVASEASGRRGLADEVTVCEFSQTTVLTDETAVSQLSGKTYRTDQKGQCRASGRTGHQSEFYTCSVTDQLVSPEESAVSDVSGRVACAQYVRKSAKEPFRQGIDNEFVVCSVSRLALLIDEVAECSVTGHKVDEDLLVASEESGQPALEETLVECEVSHRKLLPEETVVSPVSGLRIAKSLTRPSDVSGIRALPDELEKCEVSDQLLLPGEVDICAVTELLVDRRLLVPSDVSGKRVLKDRLVRCAVSGRTALPDELEECEITGACILPEELVTSHLSGKRFRGDQKCVSASSGRAGHQSESVACEYTGRKLLQDETGRSHVTGNVTAQNELHQSEHSGRYGVESELVRCSETGTLALCDETAQSDVSGQVCLQNLLIRSDASDRRGLRRELVQCEVSDVFLLPDEAAHCAVTELLVDRRLLIPSDVSGKRALKDRLVRCAVSGRTALPDELEACALSGELMHPHELESCSVSGIRAKRSLLTQTHSRKFVVPENAVKCFRTDVVLGLNEAAYCQWNDQFLVRTKAAVCRRTGLTFSRHLMSEAGDFKLFGSLLSGQQGMSDYAGLVKWLRKQRGGALSSAANAWGVESKRGESFFLVVDLQTWAGFRRKNAIVVISQQGKKRLVVGNITEASSGGNGWNVISQADGTPVTLS
jgi:superfamily II DNA or RNA helicase